MKDVWLFRHAESLANVGAATSTPREIPLSDRGSRQANELAVVLSSEPDLIVVSPYDRARQTAAPLIDRFRNAQLETRAIQEFTYLSVSRCRNTNSEQRKPWVEEYWNRSDPNYCDGDQAESFLEFIGRTRRFVRELRDLDFDLAYVFTHGQTMKALMWVEMQLSSAVDTAAMKNFEMFMKSFKIPNASRQKVLIDANGNLHFGRIEIVLNQNHA